MGRLSSKVVAITGASAGIGRATALAAAAEGATVVLSARRVDRLEQLAAEIRAGNGTALAVPGNVSSDADMRMLVDRAVGTYGHLDVMICNAGIGYHGPLDQTPAGAMRRLVDVNVMGTFYAAHAALVAMRRQRRGHIIAISSIAGRRGIGGSSIYSATKAAQIGFIEALRAEFFGSDLHASIVYPVSTTTEFHDAIARDFGHAVSGKGPRQSPETVATSIVQCILSPRAEVYPYRNAWWLSVMSVVAPKQTDRLITRFGRRRTPHHPDNASTDEHDA